MPVLVTRRIAPEDSNSLAAYEALGVEVTRIPTSDPTKVQTTTEEAQKKDPSFWQGVSTFFQSEAFKDLASTGLNTYQAIEARKMAEKDAKSAQAQATQNMLLSLAQQQQASSDLQMAQKLRATAAAAQASQPVIVQAPPKEGLPGWVIPAAVGSGALVLVLALMGRKKKAA